MKRLFLPLLLLPLSLSAQTLRETSLGFGASNVLDTYLTPLEYTGPTLSVLHRTERSLRRSQTDAATTTDAPWHIVAHYGATGAYLSSPTDDGRALDGALSARGGLVRRWHVAEGWCVAVGGQLGGRLGFTYNTRLQNNPAQGRFGVELSALAYTSYRFTLLRRTMTATVEASAPMLGTQFTPGFGRSYYELFSLGNDAGIFKFSTPFNAPSLTLSARLALPASPTSRTRLLLGYEGDFQQHKLAGLKYHGWRNMFVVGVSRNVWVK